MLFVHRNSEVFNLHNAKDRTAILLIPIHHTFLDLKVTHMGFEPVSTWLQSNALSLCTIAPTHIRANFKNK